MRRSLSTAVSLLMITALSACTRANDVLEPSAIAPQASQGLPAAQGDPALGTPAMQATAPVSPAVLSKTLLQIAPIVGATVEAATPLTERLALRARERGIRLAGSAGTSPTHVLKGYFSAIAEGKDTTVIYVWDIYDPAGNRLHRINGQQKAPSAKGSDAWSTVSPATMQAIADATVDQFATWLGGQTG